MHHHKWSHLEIKAELIIHNYDSIPKFINAEFIFYPIHHFPLKAHKALDINSNGDKFMRVLGTRIPQKEHLESLRYW